MTLTALPTGQPRRKAMRAAKTVARKAVSIVCQLVRRNGPAYLAVRNEAIGITAWVRRRPRAALIGLVVLVLIGVFTSWPTAATCALTWWALTRIPRARAERRRLVFHAAATITRTPTEIRLHNPSRKVKIRPRSRVHVRRWAPYRIRSVPVMFGTVPQRGVISYDPKFAKDYRDAPARRIFEAVVEQRLRGHHTHVEYGFDWQPGLCRVAFRILPRLPVGKLPYTHQETLPWHRLPVGPTRSGAVVTVDLFRRPHVILSGATGSGKTSVAMCWLAHLLRFPFVEIVLIDPARLDFVWAKEYVDIYASDLRAVTGVLDRVRTEAERRLSAYEQMDDWRDNPLPLFPGMVVIVEEMAVFIRAVERRLGKDAANAARDDLLTLAELGRKCNIHLVAIAQQPNADVFNTTEARDQFEWSVLCANPSKEHRVMLSSAGLQLPDLNQPGRVAVIEGQTKLTEAHAFWLASPTTPGVSAEDREAAMQWLPDPDTAIDKVAEVTVTAVSREPVAGQVEATEVACPDSLDTDEATVVQLAKRRRSS